MSITLENVSKNFKIEESGAFMLFRKNKKSVDVLKNVNLNISKGQIIGITGENGSGKTTLLKIIADILKPSSGEVKIEGKLISLFSVPSSLSHLLTLKDSVYLWCAFAGLNKKEVDKIYDSVIEKANLGEFKNAGPRQFSQGMIARVMLSIGLHIKSDVIILDEVFSPLDENFKQFILDEFKKLAARGTIILIASHDQNLIENNCYQVIKLQKRAVTTQNSKI